MRSQLATRVYPEKRETPGTIHAQTRIWARAMVAGTVEGSHACGGARVDVLGWVSASQWQHTTLPDTRGPFKGII